jgi:hypothetical protein
VVTTTQIHVVCTISLTNESDFGQPRTSTAVGATSHAHNDGVLSHAVLLDDAFKLGDEFW